MARRADSDANSESNSDANSESNSYTDSESNSDADSHTNPGADGVGQRICYQGTERQGNRRSDRNTARTVWYPDDFNQRKRKLFILRRRDRFHIRRYTIAKPLDFHTDVNVDSGERNGYRC
jgi:hypothetical protein